MPKIPGQRPPVRYVRLLSYDNACKLIDFICKDDTGKLEDNYAYITAGGVGTQVNDEDWNKVEDFLEGLNVRYEVGLEAPHVVEKQIVNNLKEKGEIN